MLYRQNTTAAVYLTTFARLYEHSSSIKNFFQEMSISIEIFQLILLNFCAIAVLNLFGKLVTPLIIPNTTDKPFFNFFFESLIGLISIVCIYSIYKSGFKTINLLGFILIIGYSILNKSSVTYNIRGIFSKIPLQPYLYTACITGLITLLSISYAYKGEVDEDVAFYSSIAKELGFSGKENILHYFNNFENLGTMPYHYMELWLGAILFKLKWFGLSNAIIFRYGCYAILRTLAVVGFLALIETIKKINILDVFISVLLLVFNTLFITELFNSSWGLQTSMWLRPNLIIYYIFLLAAFTLILYKNYTQALLIILLLTVAAGPTSPSIYSSLFIGLLILAFINRNNRPDRIFYLKWLAVVIVFAFLILLFYKLTGEEKKVWNPKFDTIDDIIIYTKSIWKAIVFFIVSLPIRTFAIMAIPLAFLLLVFRNDFRPLIKRNGIIIAFSLLLATSAIFIFQLTTFIDNTYQFPYLGYTACYILSVFLFYYIVHKATSKPINYLAITATILYLTINCLNIKEDLKLDFNAASLSDLNLKRQNISIEYIAELNAFLKGKKDLIGGFAYGMDEPDKIDYSPENTPHSTAQLGSYLYYINSNIRLLPLTDPAKLYESLDAESFFYRRYKVVTDLLPFYKENYDGNYNSLLKNYFTKSRVDFIIADKNFNLDHLKDICILKHFSDKNTGHQFIALCN